MAKNKQMGFVVAFGTVLALGVLHAGEASAAPVNLFVNGNFDGSAAGWTLPGNNVCTAPSYVSGMILLNECGSGGADPIAYQSVSNLTVGAKYVISWDYKLYVNSGNSANGKSFGVFVDGTAVKLTETLSYSFVRESAEFIAQATTQVISFAAELDQRTPGVPTRTDVSYYLDNVDLHYVSGGPVTNVSEPMSLALLAAGLAGAAGLKRRKTAE